MHRKNKISDSRFQRFHGNLISCYNSEKNETSPETSEVSPEVSAAAPPISSSLIPEIQAWIASVVELALIGKLTEAVALSVKPAFQSILGEGPVWFCPDQVTADSKAPDLAFTGEELAVVIPLLHHGDRQLAEAVVMAKRILGGTIMVSSLDPEAAQPSDDLAVLSSQEEAKDDGSTGQQKGGVSQSTPEGLASPGRHLVKISKVLCYLHNFPEYTGPRARLEMEILEGPDTGKTIVDNISLPHPQEPPGRKKRRIEIAYRLGLIPHGARGTVKIDWNCLEGKIGLAHYGYKTISGRVFPTVEWEKYEHKES